MDLWYPPDDQPPLLEWWTPLLLAASAARREGVRWPIHLDEFDLRGRVDRSTRPAVWIYQHRTSRRDLALDAAGQPYRFTPTKGPGAGRFTACDIRAAVHQAGLPAHVGPVWYDEPPTPRVPEWSGSLDEPEEADPDEPGAGSVGGSAARPRRRPRPGARRGHLTLVHGGRQAG